MLLIAAGTTQALLLSEMLLRRVLLLVFPSKRNPLQRFADTSALSSFAFLCLNAITVPLQAVASIMNTIGRCVVLMAFACCIHCSSTYVQYRCCAFCHGWPVAFCSA